ncbi:alpha/beta fold hydrolase [Protaetiibacter larvae]|uniref:Alpha/beta hydrolase n=1 Tax=Protaetiibacter larvae TaxID=2592654 RepID=A0A5C1Y757_9MICO|nr:alpha/beta hydrolase [Protaetiibacter larvae]QEO09169.1 alpha/beta hydrolase [Protaetiibacter larvae]
MSVDAPTIVASADGTSIASYRAGTGPVVILVDAALSTHEQSRRLGALLEPRFTVVRYDRRGRAGSGDVAPGAADPAREVEDLAAVITANGGSAILFGSSSGAALALEAAAHLGDRVAGLVLYEPPFIVDDSRPPVPRDLPERIASEVVAGRRGRALALFLREAMSIPAVGVAAMRLTSNWAAGKRLVHTLGYDFAALAGTQDGRPLPRERWGGITARGVVMAGERSEPFFHDAARALSELLPRITYRSLEGGHHGSAVMSPGGIAAVFDELWASPTASA